VLTEVRAELEDRYGKPPESVLHLLAAGEIRLTCERLGIAQIERKRTAIEAPKKPAPNAAKPASRPAFGAWSAQPARPALAGRHGQPPQTSNLQFSNRAVTARPVTNATLAAREIAAARPGSAGQMKAMREMLYITFSDKLHAAPVEGVQGISPGLLMKLVARNAKNGAQLSPQGVLKWPLSSAQADVVLTETRELLSSLDVAGA
jgi:transcription-repair coupling factor (superfamily II helicase)